MWGKGREALLQLYNALNGTDYRDASSLKIVTIESVVYIVMKNDLAFVLAGVLNLYEHQSTCNPNMPVRCLRSRFCGFRSHLKTGVLEEYEKAKKEQDYR